jgi:RNA polymerase sigma factor (sigma-70 family)
LKLATTNNAAGEALSVKKAPHWTGTCQINFLRHFHNSSSFGTKALGRMLRPTRVEHKMERLCLSAKALEGSQMLPEGSVTRQIGMLKEGDQAAAQQLWQRYFRRLVYVARQRLHPSVRRVADEEDVALRAFTAFCQRAEQGRLPQVRDRDDLWRLLVTLTVRMAVDEVRREHRQKRGGREGSSQASSASLPPRDANPDHYPAPQPSPEFVAQVAEECDRLLGALDDETLKSIAVWKIEGYTNEEIAANLGVVLRTVERKVRTIRQRLSGG